MAAFHKRKYQLGVTNRPLDETDGVVLEGTHYHPPSAHSGLCGHPLQALQHSLHCSKFNSLMDQELLSEWVEREVIGRPISSNRRIDAGWLDTWLS